MKQYLDLLQDIMDNGEDVEDRTGTGTRSVFGRQLRFNLADGFPLVTTKKVHLKSIIHELLWFIKGETNVKYLQDNGVKIWDAWAKEDGELGPVYGKQWRRWGAGYKDSAQYDIDGTPTEIDQLANVIERIKTNPDCRRLIVSAWNVGELDQMALSPCHCFIQFKVYSGKLSCHMYQRSADLLLGVPFNIASYALLTQMIAQVCKLELGDLIISFGDVHIYQNHFEQVKEQLTREPYPLPKMLISKSITNINDFTFKDFQLVDYQCHPAIKAEVSV